MTYRLIDANALAMKCKEVNDMPCIYADLPNGLDGGYYDLARLGSGTLTAEQVRDTVERHWHDLSADYDMPESSALPEYSYDWKAIADELNTRAEMSYEDALILLDELGVSERTCHEVMVDKYFHGCSECGYMWEYMYRIGKRERPNYCPNCGARVIKSDQYL